MDPLEKDIGVLLLVLGRTLPSTLMLPVAASVWVGGKSRLGRGPPGPRLESKLSLKTEGEAYMSIWQEIACLRSAK